jgi:adenylate kinase
MMKNLWLFMGPPGCGKGTQATKLKARGFAEHLSTGDVLRAAIRSGFELGKKVQAFVDGGRLVPDEVMLDVLMATILDFKGEVPLVLDGYPRTLSQGESLLEIIKSSSGTLNLKGAIWFDIRTDILVRRAVSRRVCSSCGAIYNLEFKPPKISGICDLCGGLLVHRKDDNEETILKRIQVYNSETEPLLNFINRNSYLVKLDADRPENAIFEEIVMNLKK